LNVIIVLESVTSHSLLSVSLILCINCLYCLISGHLWEPIWALLHRGPGN